MADVNISYLNRGKQLDIIVDSIGVNNLIEGLFTTFGAIAASSRERERTVDNSTKEHVRLFR